MHFHDAELMRLLAHTFTDPQERRNALATASSTRGTKAQPCSNCAACWILSTCSVTVIAPSWPTLSAAFKATVVGRNSHGRTHS